MKKAILLITLGSAILMGANITAQTANDPKVFDKPIKAEKLKKMDRRLTKHKAVKRKFRTQKEFQRLHRKRALKQRFNQGIHANRPHKDYGYNDNYRSKEKGRRDTYHPAKQHGYRHSNRGWYLAYRYDRASFYDKYGYHYGYFNRQGYYFEGMFYRYDRRYTYRDRVKGRELFGFRYYMPANYRYYGFCKPGYSRRGY